MCQQIYPMEAEEALKLTVQTGKELLATQVFQAVTRDPKVEARVPKAVARVPKVMLSQAV